MSWAYLITKILRYKYFYIFKKISVMHSFTTEIWGKGYHIYRSPRWNNFATHQPTKVIKEANRESINIVKSQSVDWIKLKERQGISTRNFEICFLIHVGWWVNNIIYCWYPSSGLPQDGLEIPLFLSIVRKSEDR